MNNKLPNDLPIPIKSTLNKLPHCVNPKGMKHEEISNQKDVKDPNKLTKTSGISTSGKVSKTLLKSSLLILP